MTQRERMAFLVGLNLGLQSPSDSLAAFPIFVAALFPDDYHATMYLEIYDEAIATLLANDRIRAAASEASTDN